MDRLFNTILDMLMFFSKENYSAASKWIDTSLLADLLGVKGAEAAPGDFPLAHMCICMKYVRMKLLAEKGLVLLDRLRGFFSIFAPES